MGLCRSWPLRLDLKKKASLQQGRVAWKGWVPTLAAYCKGVARLLIVENFLDGKLDAFIEVNHIGRN